MAHYIENIDIENEKIFNDWYEIEGVRKIKELSRQLRTFFNYKKEVIRYRFRSNLISLETKTATKYFTQKQKFESLIYEFLNLLNEFKKQGYSVEEAIRNLYYENNASQINQLSTITESLSNLIHFFSEKNIYEKPRLLKLIFALIQNIFLVKKSLYTQFTEFYEELRKNYSNLETELESILEKTSESKISRPEKQLEGNLFS